jgi:transposase
MFPNGVTHITNELAFEKKDGKITYFNGHMPVFRHEENDIASFRMITGQFCATGYTKQSDITRAFGVTVISVKRSVKLYREKGIRGFYAPRATRGAAVLVDEVVAQVEELLAGGASVAEVATTLGLKRNTVEKAIREGRIRAPVKKNSPTLHH